MTKTSSNWFGLIFSVWLGFLVLARFFSDLAWFFYLGSVLFFRFQAYKTKPVGFFKILIGFFYGSVFSIIFFQFSRFFDFFTHP
jgi:hypothetical protein